MTPTNTIPGEPLATGDLAPEAIIDENNEDSGDGTTSNQQILQGATLFLVIVSIFLAMLLAALDQTIVATILLTVGTEFQAFSKIQWITSGYLLSAAVLSPSWGKLSIIFGRKWCMLAAIVLFEIGSVVCGAAVSMDMLIGGRVIAGIGGGGIQMLVILILTEIAPIQKRGMTQSLIGVAFGVASIAGPLVGGAFASNVTWRWCFYINLPFGAMTILAVLVFFNPPPSRGSLKEKVKMIDYLGTFLLTSGLVLILLGLTFGGDQYAWNSAAVILCFVLGGVIITLFSIYNFRFSSKPLIPWAVVRVPTVLMPVLTMTFVFMAFIGGIIYLSVYFQVVGHASAIESGLHLLPWLIATIVVSIVTGIMISKTRFIKPFTLTGIVIMCIGFGVLTLLQVDSTASERIGYLIIPGFGTGFMMQSLALATQVAAPKERGGVLLATTLLGFGRSLGGVIGVAVSQTILNVSLLSKLAQHNFGVDFDTHTFINNPAAILGLPKDVIDDLMRIYVESIRNVMYFCLACCLAGFVSSVFITNKRIPPPRTIQNPNAIEKDLGTNDMSTQSASESGSGRSGMIQSAARVDVERGDTKGR
ncbi:major facilitator superfamily domain-containing protein [Lipomyces tetrasporus]|uniref:Major facilitator superfamily domain-containing protein n=1 Tax=Lipomyces tetrasporus TaxID=54092 RepID=A0AAD7QLX6_9ASCO|nr:major facilitator superfamily domain-containing protein [Lipomyces tetrasporus]KAJ8097654.1 major facilitator superfamily domain-containing protein [Lipomyces tetrasporus]